MLGLGGRVRRYFGALGNKHMQTRWAQTCELTEIAAQLEDLLGSLVASRLGLLAKLALGLRSPRGTSLRGFGASTGGEWWRPEAEAHVGAAEVHCQEAGAAGVTMFQSHFLPSTEGNLLPAALAAGRVASHADWTAATAREGAQLCQGPKIIA